MSFKSFEAFEVYAGCPRCADEGVAEKFCLVRTKHAALVAVDPQLGRPLDKLDQGLDHSLSRRPRFDIDVVVVCVSCPRYAFPVSTSADRGSRYRRTWRDPSPPVGYVPLGLLNGLMRILPGAKSVAEFRESRVEVRG